MDCPQCGEPDMIFFGGERYENCGDDQCDCIEKEPDAYMCPECGHMEVL